MRRLRKFTQTWNRLVLAVLLGGIVSIPAKGTHQEKRDPVDAGEIVVLLDASQSMKFKDQRVSKDDLKRVAIALGLEPGEPAIPKDPTRADLVRGVLANKQLNLLEKLRKQRPVRVLLFGDKLRPGDLAGFPTEDKRTALADAIHELLRRKDTLPRAIVVMTDGQDNASKLTLNEVAAECARVAYPNPSGPLGEVALASSKSLPVWTKPTRRSRIRSADTSSTTRVSVADLICFLATMPSSLVSERRGDR